MRYNLVSNAAFFSIGNCSLFLIGYLKNRLSMTLGDIFQKRATFIDQSWHGQEELVAVKDNKPNPVIQLIVKLKGILAVFFVLPALALTIYLEQNQLGFLFDVLFSFSYA